jgi:hypothetical protein
MTTDKVPAGFFEKPDLQVLAENHRLFWNLYTPLTHATEICITGITECPWNLVKANQHHHTQDTWRAKNPAENIKRKCIFGGNYTN